MDEALYGANVAARMEAADAALAIINKKYEAYFAGIKSKYAKEGENTPATLSEFTHIEWNNARAGIGILPGLREDIAEEARQAFSRAVSE
jgi:hypothetical protein